MRSFQKHEGWLRTRSRLQHGTFWIDAEVGVGTQQADLRNVALVTYRYRAGMPPESTVIQGWPSASRPGGGLRPRRWSGLHHLAVPSPGTKVWLVKRSGWPVRTQADGLAARLARGVPTPEVLAVSGEVLVLEHVLGSPDWEAWVGIGACTG